MDEEISIIDTNTRNEKVKNFFIKNKKNLIIIISTIIILLMVFISFNLIQEKNQVNLANKYNLAKIEFKNDNTQKTVDDMINIVKAHDVTYSPLALYFLIDNDLIKNPEAVSYTHLTLPTNREV